MTARLGFTLGFFAALLFVRPKESVRDAWFRDSASRGVRSTAGTGALRNGRGARLASVDSGGWLAGRSTSVEP